MSQWDTQFKRHYGQKLKGKTVKEWLEPFIYPVAGQYPKEGRTYDERQALLVVHARHALYAFDGPHGDIFASNNTSSIHEFLKYTLYDHLPGLTLERYFRDIEALQQQIAEQLKSKNLRCDWVFERPHHIHNVPAAGVQVMIDYLASHERYTINQPEEPYDYNALVWAYK